jgi:hypothetical protein
MRKNHEDDKISRRQVLGAVLAGATALTPRPARRAWRGSGEAEQSTGNSNPLLHSLPSDLIRLGDSVAVRGTCEGIPVYGFGYTYIYGVSPDFVRGTQLQVGNDSPVAKVRPKKSWEITENKLGATPPREPRTARTDQQPFLGLSVIDGDPDTYWSCRGQCQPDVEPAWVRIDLAVATLVKTVVIVPRADNLGMPNNLTIKVSRDAWHWETVYANPKYEVPRDTKPREFSFDARPVKQVWIIGSDLPLLGWFYCMSIAGVEVIAENGENVALVSRGAGVTVSSCDFGISSEREMFQMLWPVHLDLGLKWVRVGYAGPGALNWNFVERVKGQYEVDPEADRAITQLADNGVNIVLCLAFTNWLYTPQGGPNPKDAKHTWEGTEAQSLLPRPDIPGMLEGYMNFARFMVRHFKDRALYYEIWNEQSGNYGHMGDPKLYSEYVRRTAPIIREEHPKARIVLGSVTGFNVRRNVGIDYLEARLEEGLGQVVDAIGWHPCYSCNPADQVYMDYPKEFKQFRQFAESHGFRGEYMCTEWDMFAPYPMAPKYEGQVYSELVKAKYSARFAIMNVGLNIIPFWNETWNNHHIDRDVGLFRNTFSMEPISPTQPQPAYYVMRTLSTVLEAVTPFEMEVQFSNNQQAFEYFAFALPNGDRLLSVCLATTSKDVSDEVSTNITFPDRIFKSATGIDVLNGTFQPLKISIEGGSTMVRQILMKDYPIVLRLRTTSPANLGSLS